MHQMIVSLSPPLCLSLCLSLSLSLCLCLCLSPPFPPLPSLSEGCQRLEHINLSYCDNITAEGIRSLTTKCPRLRHIIVKYCGEVHTCVYVTINVVSTTDKDPP